MGLERFRFKRWRFHFPVIILDKRESTAAIPRHSRRSVSPSFPRTRESRSIHSGAKRRISTGRGRPARRKANDAGEAPALHPIFAALRPETTNWIPAFAGMTGIFGRLIQRRAIFIIDMEMKSFITARV
jgi:hypothetical protein